MRTVIISTKQHIEWINHYHLFYEPFRDSEISFCEWNTDGKDIDEMIPQIYECIDRSREWRAVIILDDEKNQTHLNPFDVVTEKKVTPPITEDVRELLQCRLEKYSDYLKNRAESKKEAYESAEKQPLTRLCTFLCEANLDVNENEETTQYDLKELGDEGETRVIEIKEAMEFNYYKEVANYKRRVRDRLINNKRLHACYPKEVDCISFRTIIDNRETEAQKLALEWNQGTGVVYSDFTDRNMYYDKMRFFVFDILPENHENYNFNRLQFIYTLLLMAQNETPSDTVHSGKLYCLESTCDEEKLRELVRSYDQKLANTIGTIRKKKEDIEADTPEPMTDDEAEMIFQSKEIIDVTLNPHFKDRGIHPDDSVFGLSKNCPDDEKMVWRSMSDLSGVIVRKLLRQPRRSLEKAVGEFRIRSSEESVKALGLNHFQLEDIKEYAEVEEDKMVSIVTNDFYDVELYDQKLQNANRNVNEVINTRMEKKTTVILGIIVLFVFFIGFIPLLFFNEDVLSIPLPLIITLISLALLAIVGFITLFFLRKELKKTVEKYNAVVSGIENDVRESMSQFSQLLSSACRVMRCNSVIDLCRKGDRINKKKIRILRGHIDQIREKQREIRDTFGEYVKEYPRPSSGDVYEYNFEKVEEYEYPMPVNDNEDVTIPYMDSENRVKTPFDFIEGITLRLEDLYE